MEQNGRGWAAQPCHAAKQSLAAHLTMSSWAAGEPHRLSVFGHLSRIRCSGLGRATAAPKLGMLTRNLQEKMVGSAVFPQHMWSGCPARNRHELV